MAHADMKSALDRLIAARRGGGRPAGFQPEAAPKTLTEAYGWQDALLAQLGPVAGWKVGSDSPASEPFRAGFTASTLHQSPARLDRGRFNVIGIEAEIM
jgi:2-keto-4-pentenoate hydratase